jgi:hypothetical protein
MDMRGALKEQFHAGLAMLAECVEKCPDDLWVSGVYPRFYWRIAFHAAFFTQLGLGKDLSAFEPWPGRREGIHEGLWETPEYVEPYELPDGVERYSQVEIGAYIQFVDGLVDRLLDDIDLESESSGFPWYQNMSKVSNVLMNLRHVQGHVGQLSELLMARGIDISWIGKGRASDWAAWEKSNP